jgi:hypothetical protein
MGYLLCLCPVNGDASIIGNFTAHWIDGGGLVDDQDPFPLGDPDRYFSMGIFDNASSFSACANGCTGDTNPNTFDATTDAFTSENSGTGFWDFPDRTVSKVIQPGGTGAYFYFGLWDEDFDEDDSLGDHWFYANQPTGGIYLNNNAAPFYAGHPIETVGGREVEGIGDDRNFYLNYSVTFEDTTAPFFSSAPTHFDASSGTDTNDDTELTFLLPQFRDPDSGISLSTFSLIDVTTGEVLFSDEAFNPFWTQLQISSLGPFPADIRPDHDYRFGISLTNGLAPVLTNQNTAFTPFVLVKGASIEQPPDDPPPTTSLPLPATGWLVGSSWVFWVGSNAGMRPGAEPRSRLVQVQIGEVLTHRPRITRL